MKRPETVGGRILLGISAAGLGAVILGGCAAASEGGLTAEQRYAQDYAGDIGPGSGAFVQSCLANSAYDPERFRADSAAVNVVKGEIVIIPASTSGASELHFKDEGTSKPLQPADLQTTSVLQAYGCEMGQAKSLAAASLDIQGVFR